MLPEHQDHAAAWLADAYHGKNTRNIDLAVRTQCGARVDLLLSILSRSAHGGSGGAIVVGHDITLRKRAEGQPEHELQAFIATANAPIVDAQPFPQLPSPASGVEPPVRSLRPDGSAVITVTLSCMQVRTFLLKVGPGTPN